MLLLMDPGEMYYDCMYIALFWYSNCHFKGYNTECRERESERT